MSDLTDALAESDKWFERGTTLMVDKRHPFVAAARRVAEAPEVWWCEKHHAASHPPGPELRCDVWVVAGCEDFLLAEPCRMVRKLLVDPPHQP